MLVESARSLEPQAGRGRVWLWCGARLPSRRFITLLAGFASLHGVSRTQLGLELSAHALEAAQQSQGRRWLDELRCTGIDVLLRLPVPLCPAVSGKTPASGALVHEDVSGPASPRPDLQRVADKLARLHALGLSVAASGVWHREWAAQLGEAGFAAVSGPAVCQAMDLGALMNFIGRPERGLARMSAHSI